MSDLQHHDFLPRRGWPDAFATLPLDSPDASVLPAMFARLDARRRMRWPLWLATAATLALLLVSPPLSRMADEIGAAHDDGTVDARPLTVPGVAAATSASSEMVVSNMRAATSGRPSTTAVDDEGGAIQQAIASALPKVALSTAPSTAALTAASGAGDRSLSDFERLYAESAQLEAVLAMARNDRVVSGPASVLFGELNAYVAAIDAALSQPTLPQTQQLALWEQRIDVMRQLASFESTQRWLANNGERYDGPVASVD